MARSFALTFALFLAGCPGTTETPGTDGGRDGGGLDAPCWTASCACAEPDADGDGENAIACGGLDCDDDDPNRSPGRTEVCDTTGRDEDCRPDTFGFVDLDADGFVDAVCCNDDGSGGQNCGDDCNDMRASTYPGASEVCNEVDDDCNEIVDEGVMMPFYVDADGDLYGDPTVPTELACSASPGLVANDDDCDDTNPNAHSTTGAEVCDTADNDCDAIVDEGVGIVAWYPDDDGDGRGDETATPVMSCAPVADHVTNDGDCDDAVATTFDGAPELCNDVDDDCSSGGGAIDTEDGDDDMHARTGVCSGGPFPGDDCDDFRASVHPGQTTYFGTPIDCPGGLWCATYACCTPPLVGCFGTSNCDAALRPDFDYDCSGAAERQPAAAGVCGPIAGGACAPVSGPQYVAAPACGSTVDFATCRRSSGTGTCEIVTTPGPLGCR